MINEHDDTVVCPSDTPEIIIIIYVPLISDQNITLIEGHVSRYHEYEDLNMTILMMMDMIINANNHNTMEIFSYRLAPSLKMPAIGCVDPEQNCQHQAKWKILKN